MEKHFDRQNASGKILCADESDFYIFCKMNGFIPKRFEQSDGWQGLYVELANICFVYYFGENVMLFFEIDYEHEVAL